MLKAREKGGFYLKRTTNPDERSFKDFENLWTFHGFFSQEPAIWLQWLKANGVLAGQNQIRCQHEVEGGFICGMGCSLQKRSARIDDMTWRCKKNKDHETSVRFGSFLSKSKHTIPDIMEFTKNYLDNHTMKKCASFSNVAYKSTACYWLGYLRDCFIQYIWEDVIQAEMKLTGTLEVDESHFCKKCKYHLGSMKSKINVWIVGLVERREKGEGKGRQLMYPVWRRGIVRLF